jgi:hemerythrin-like domain-containing protein
MADDGAVEVIFFDVRDTLGEVDRPGHLVPYRPSTERLLKAMRNDVGLRIGLITNLPDDVDADAGRRMVSEAVLSESSDGDGRLTIGDLVEPEGIVINHDVGVSKPDPRIYKAAAERMGTPVERCMFVGENLIEVLGARAAGMQTELKPCPPGREFLPANVTGLRATATDSGRAFEAFFEHEHLLGDRIFVCAQEIADRLRAVGEGERIPDEVYSGMAILVYLTNNFADQAHLKAEEAAIPIAVARGMDVRHAEWVFAHHEQTRAYFRAMDIAFKRIQGGEEADRPWAIADFARNAEGFVALLIHHAERENDELYPEMGRYFTDTDDTLVINLLSQIGPRDFTPYVGLVSAMEQTLGLPSPE